MKIHKILWPTDLSHSCDLVLPYVCSLAEAYGASLVVMYVADDLSDYKEWYGELTEEHAAKLRDWEVEHAEKRLDEVCRTGLTACPILEKRIALGDPAEEILKAAEEEGVDLVIMASRGRGAEKLGLDRFGSVAGKVSRQAKVPVTIVPPDISDNLA